MIVSESSYAMVVKWSDKHNRQIAKFHTLEEPHIDIEFPLPDRYASATKLDPPAEELLALVFSNIVQTAIRTARDQTLLAQLRNARQPALESETQRALAGDEGPPESA